MIFVHKGVGHYVGSNVVVDAPNLAAARKTIRNILDKRGLQSEKLKIRKIPLKKSDVTVILIDDGDY